MDVGLMPGMRARSLGRLTRTNLPLTGGINGDHFTAPAFRRFASVQLASIISGYAIFGR